MVSDESSCLDLSVGETLDVVVLAVRSQLTLVSHFRFLRIADATCVSALFGIKFLMVLFDADAADVFDFSIGGRVLEILANSESPGLMKNFN